MPKNIVVFSDGTGNRRFENRDTNVAKLYGFMEVDSDDQVAFYDSGVGTNYLKITGSAFGLGLSKNIMECYDFIAHRYEPGDAIFLFGFSRGAFTVRRLGYGWGRRRARLHHENNSEHRVLDGKISRQGSGAQRHLCLSGPCH
ncbi:MAG: DUF2235 domain-containing protein [Nitrospinota bacterium]